MVSNRRVSAPLVEQIISRLQGIEYCLLHLATHLARSGLGVRQDGKLNVDAVRTISIWDAIDAADKDVGLEPTEQNVLKKADNTVPRMASKLSSFPCSNSIGAVDKKLAARGTEVPSVAQKALLEIEGRWEVLNGGAIRIEGGTVQLARGEARIAHDGSSRLGLACFSISTTLPDGTVECVQGALTDDGCMLVWSDGDIWTRRRGASPSKVSPAPVKSRANCFHGVAAAARRTG